MLKCRHLSILSHSTEALLMTVVVYVANIPPDVTDEEFRHFFEGRAGCLRAQMVNRQNEYSGGLWLRHDKTRLFKSGRVVGVRGSSQCAGRGGETARMARVGAERRTATRALRSRDARRNGCIVQSICQTTAVR